MCGVFGFVLNRALREEDLELGRAGTAALRHRGPDASGHWADRRAGIFLGHTRLSIIDLSPASNQPMRRHGAILVYNGEIYNFREIREELKVQGVVFSTSGDTEVVLQAWLKWGSEALNRFDGMFAFALYNNGQIHLVTDPFGEKPLYRAETSGGIYFASETGVLARLLGCPASLDDEDIGAFLGLGFLPAPHTGYRGLYRLAPATHLAIESGRVRFERRYWTPPRPACPSGRVRPVTERDLDRLHGIILDSLRTRTYSDAPIGIFLSSGTDSSLVAAMAVKELGLQLQALTVAFPDGRDESTQAAAIARYLGVPHTVIDSREDPVSVSPEFVRELLGDLNDNLTVAAARHIALVARPFMKVALTGMGGDEFFYGYGRYQLLYRYRNLFALPAGARLALSSLAGTLFSAWRPLRTARDLLSATDVCRIMGVKNGASCPWLWTLPATEAVARRLFSSDGLPLFVAARQFDLTHTMPTSYIPAVERGSMRASLEVRTPFLNRQLLDTIATMDQRAFVAFGQKDVLKRILARYLPASFYQSPKQGFVFPHARFLNSLPARSPVIRGLPPVLVHDAWRRRSERGWERLAVRLAILELWTESKSVGEEIQVAVP